LRPSHRSYDFSLLQLFFNRPAGRNDDNNIPALCFQGGAELPRKRLGRPGLLACPTVSCHQLNWQKTAAFTEGGDLSSAVYLGLIGQDSLIIFRTLTLSEGENVEEEVKRIQAKMEQARAQRNQQMAMETQRRNMQMKLQSMAMNRDSGAKSASSRRKMAVGADHRISDQHRFGWWAIEISTQYRLTN
jgi:hypothetical protein